MNAILEYLMGMNKLTDQVIATDLLISAKSGIRSYAVAVTEAATPEIKSVLRRHLEEAITTHEQLTDYMMKKGYYQPYHMNEQIQLDLTNMQAALNIPT
ncbi:spore coat protein [Marinicrinis lubricantis]|uniref:Spore coat protein n=1 Tax=Marinicrinis lubricantis TaxID=2086470 RepID=A0ABW1IP52_9BACL